MKEEDSIYNRASNRKICQLEEDNRDLRKLVLLARGLLPTSNSSVSRHVILQVWHADAKKATEGM